MGNGSLKKHRKAEERFLLPFLYITSGIFVLLRGGVSRFLGVEWLDIDLISIVFVYLLGKDKEIQAVALAFFLGIMTDIFAPCRLGLFALTYTVTTAGLSRCRQFLDFNNAKTLALLVGVFLLVKWAFLVGLLGLFPVGQLIPSISLISVFLSALITSVLALFLFYFLDHADEEKRSQATIPISGDHHGGTFGA
jgi:rod shape-determining protein MreD